MSDEHLFEISNEQQGTGTPFVSRQVVQVLDQNGGNYNGQIHIDTSSLSNSGKYASYGEAYLVIPLVTSLTCNTAGSQAVFDAADFPFGAGLKCGNHQLIHSLSVMYNNSDVVQLTPYSNFYVQYKMLTSMSWDDVRKVGPSIGFYPDSSDSVSYNQTGAALGNDVRTGTGSLNNRNYPYAGGLTTWADWGTDSTGCPNKGFLERQKNGSLQFADPITTLITEANGSSVGENYYTSDATNHAKVWYTLCKIRLKDLHSFFEQLPLVKGAFLSLRINTNTASHTITSTADNAHHVNLYCAAAPIISGGTSPLMLSSSEANQGLAPLATALDNSNAVTTMTLKCSIGKETSLSANYQSHPTWGAQTRLFVPMYQMSPVNEEQYLTLNQTKKIVYHDIYSYQTDVSAGGVFNTLLTNGITNPKTVICVPILQSSANYLGNTGTDIGVAPHQSPFAAEPGTTSPRIAMKNFNVQVAGINMFASNEDYDFEAFMNELSSQNAINGNLVSGLTSGLISEADFKSNYRYYVCDISRRLPAEDSVPKSVAIMGKNLSAKAISIYTYIVFEKEMTVSLQTGQRLS